MNFKRKYFIQFLSLFIIFLFIFTSGSPVLKQMQLETTDYSSLSLETTKTTNPITMGRDVGNFSLGNDQSGLSASLSNSSKLESIVFDPANENLYVALSSNIFQINTTTNKITKDITIGKCINWMGYDSVNDLLYLSVTDNYTYETSEGVSFNYSIISYNPANGTINKPIINFNGGPYCNAIDTRSNVLYFDSSPGNISALNLTSGNISATISAGQCEMYYSNSNGLLYLGGSSMTIINTQNNSILSSHFLKNYSNEFIYDPTSNALIVTFLHSPQIYIMNGSTDTIMKKVNCALQPTGIAYNPTNHYAYVYSSNGTVEIINASNFSHVGALKIPALKSSISLLEYPTYQSYDELNGEVYLGCTVQDEILALKGTSVNNTSSIYIRSSTISALFYDRYNNNLYVSTNNETLYSFNATTLAEDGITDVGLCPQFFALNPDSCYLYVSNGASNTVSIINTKTFSTLKNVSVGLDPGDIFYCTKTNDIYVLNRASENISVFTQSGTHLSSISLPRVYNSGKAFSMIYDDHTGDLYISFTGFRSPIESVNILTGNVSGSFQCAGRSIYLDPITGNILGCNGITVIPSSSSRESSPILRGELRNPVYDSLEENIIAMNYFGDNISIINATTQYIEGEINVSGFPNSITVDLYTGTIFTSFLQSSRIAILKLFPEYNVNFKETGMNSDISWFINMNGRPNNFTIDSTSESIYLPNGTYSFTIGTSQLYSVSPQSGSVHVDGKGVTITITFAFKYFNYLAENYIYILIITGAVSAVGYFIWRRRR